VLEASSSDAVITVLSRAELDLAISSGKLRVLS
jgi:hypothetical protein